MTKAPCPNCHHGGLKLSGKRIWVVYFPGNKEGSTHDVYRCPSCNIDIVFLEKSA